jgi:hypothetical protein
MKTHRIVLSVFLGLLCFCMFGHARADVTFQDTIGDIYFAKNDIKSLTAEVDGGTLTVTLTYADNVGLTDSNYGSVFIDGDLNPDTGEKMGADCILWFCYTGVYSGGHVSLNGTLFTIGEQGTALETGVDYIRFTLPLDLWGGNDHPRLFATSSWIFGNTEYDRVPDSGYLDMASGLVVIPRPGNEAVALVYQDPAGDAEFPDLTRLEARVVDGNMLIRLGFAHGVEKADLLAAQDVLVVELKMDLDQRLWTGFANNHEQPPTFGIDRSIQIMLSDLLSVPQGTLNMRKPDDPATPLDDLDSTLIGIGPLGSQENDTRLVVGRNERFGTAANEILLSIPLAYLGYDDGAIHIMASAFLEATLAEGHADVLPDAGGLDTSIGLAPEQIVHPVAQCIAAVQTGLDGTDDSLGFGLQGDEIIASRAGALDDGGLMLSIDLESLAYDDLAYINIFVDSDGNAATGMPLYNNTAAPIGAEFYICCRIAAVPDPTIVTGLLVELRSPLLGSGIHRIDHLISLRTGGILNSQEPGAHYILNLPAEILQSVPSSTAAYMITTTQQSFTNENGIEWKDNDGVSQVGLGRDVDFLSPRGAPSLLDTAPDIGFYLVPAPEPLPLTLSSITPSRGQSAGGTPVHLFGTGFDRNATISIGGTAIGPEEIGFISSGELATTTPSGIPGPADILVENPDTGAVTTQEDAFRYAPPLVAAPRVGSITPDLGPVGGGDLVAISGSNFMAGADVTIGSAAATGIVVQSPFLITATTPAGSLGPADVKVTNSDGQWGTLAKGYNFGSRPPEIWTLFPNFGPLSGGTALTVVGSGFEPGSQVLVGGVPLSGVNVVSDRLISGTTGSGAAAGLSDVVVVKPDGVSGTFAAGFQYGGGDPGLPLPALMGVSPLSSPTAGGETITISGYNFQNGLTLLIDGYPVAIDSFDGSGRITATTPPHASGMVPIDIINPDGCSVSLPVDDSWNSFTYDSNQPSISLVNPTTSPTTGGASVLIFGSNFKPETTVTFSGFPAVVEDISPITIEVFTPPHPPGTVLVTVANPSGLSATYTGGIFGDFIYTGDSPPAPAITSLSQAQGSIFGSESVTIYGANFFTGVRVFFGANEVTDSERISSSAITITTPAAAAGAVDITVLNADGQEDILVGGFTYTAPDPILTSVDPGTGSVVGGTRITLTGSGFVPESTVMIAGNAATQVTWVDQDTLMVTAPPGFPGC